MQPYMYHNLNCSTVFVASIVLVSLSVAESQADYGESVPGSGDGGADS